MSRVYVAPISFGLGDLVVSLPAVQALIDETDRNGGETWLVARSPAQAALAGRIAGLAGTVGDDAFARDGSDGRFVDLRDHPLQTDHWWGSAEFEAAFGPMSINEILARICADFGIAADFMRPHPLTARPRPEISSWVVLVADSDGPSKRWPVERWVALADAIRDRGLDVRALTRGDDAGKLGAAGIEAAPAPTPGDAVDVLNAARAVIGVDTGPTHIAAQQGTPTITICRASAVFFRPWPHTRAVAGAPCAESCAAVEADYAYNERVDLRGFEWQPRDCPVGSRCLDAVRPEDVMQALGQLL